MRKKLLMDIEEVNVKDMFEVEDHESTASGAGFFAFFFYYNKTA